MRRFVALAAILLLGAAPAPVIERLNIISNGEVTGTLVATTAGDHISIDYQVSENGRGPKHREEIVLGPSGVPISWQVTGTSLMGGAVHERYAYADGRARWTSQADQGDVSAAKPPLYVVNDDSPYANSIYARVALASGGKVAALPAGTITTTKLRDATLGDTAVTLYRIDGLGFSPEYLALDKAGRLFASGNAIRAGYEKQLPALGKLVVEQDVARIQAISAEVAHRYDAPIRIRNVHVLDVASGKRSALSTVVTFRDRITAILPNDGGPLPAGQAVIDGEGGTLIPGLHDMHSHMTMQSGLFYLAAGVTSVRDMGNRPRFLLDLIPKLEAGTVAGPHVIRDGFIEGRSPYSSHAGFIISNLEEALRTVRWYADHGYYEIKIYNSFPPELIKPAADEAKRLGMGVTGHVPAFSHPDRVIEAGYDSIAHINQLMLGWLLDPQEDTRTPLRLTGMARAADLRLDSAPVQHTVELMKRHKVALDTTTVILERLMLSRAGTVQAGDADYLDHVPIGYQRYRKRSFVPLKDAAEDARYQAAFKRILETMALLHRHGVQMLPGTDDGTGFTLLRELELYAMAGITAAEVIRMGTLDSARYLRTDGDRGSIERGKVADLVLVAGDPTVDIRAIKAPRMVMRAGTVYFPAEIHQALSIRPFSTPPKLTPPTKEVLE
jgi:imidazolonepropionase-like amidohydrolase